MRTRSRITTPAHIAFALSTMASPTLENQSVHALPISGVGVI
jgi:hypothetical protein